MAIWETGRWAREPGTTGTWVRETVQVKMPIGFSYDPPEVLDVPQEDAGDGGEWDVSCVSQEAVCYGDDPDGFDDLPESGRRYRVAGASFFVADRLCELPGGRPPSQGRTQSRSGVILP